MATQDEFDNAIERSKALSVRPASDVLLQLYALYKQATAGDVQTTRPGGFDFKNMAKWDAWKKQEGKSREAAQEEYVELINQLAR